MKTKKVAILGTGPAGLMAASVVAQAGFEVTIFEKKKTAGAKLLIAGSTGLNITHEAPLPEFRKRYKGPVEHFQKLFDAFPPRAWLDFIHDLGIRTFQGSGGRHFVEGLKAAPFLQAWLSSLQKSGVHFEYQHECCGFESRDKIFLSFTNGRTDEYDAACLAFGGGSYEPAPLHWPEWLKKKGLRFSSFRASNVGFEVDWPPKLMTEAEGLPLKNIVLSSPLGTKNGDLVITHYGLEGTPIYQMGEVGPVYLDLKPDLSLLEIQKKLNASKENLSPIRRIKKLLNLSPASLALIFHCTPLEILKDLNLLTTYLKNFPIQLKARRPLAEAISSAGGLDFAELTDLLMLKKFAGVFAAGEMLDWDAPTGGFLIQACASQGFLAGQGIIQHLNNIRVR